MSFDGSFHFTKKKILLRENYFLKSQMIKKDRTEMKKVLNFSFIEKAEMKKEVKSTCNSTKLSYIEKTAMNREKDNKKYGIK